MYFVVLKVIFAYVKKDTSYTSTDLHLQEIE